MKPNLPDSKLVLTGRTAFDEESYKLQQKSHEAFERKKKSLLKGSLKKVSSRIEQLKSKYYLEVLRCHGNPSRVRKIKKKYRKQIREVLFRGIPNAKKIGGLHKKQSKADVSFWDERIGKFSKDNINIAQEVALPGLLEFDEFEAPFELAHTNDAEMDKYLNGYTDKFIKYNNCYSDPVTGAVVLDISFLQVVDSFFIQPFELLSIYASTGINYTVPKSGFINVCGSATCSFNKAVFSITDNFGFSSAVMQFGHDIGIMIGRSGEYKIYPRLMTYGSLNSGGDDKEGSAPEFRNHEPYLLNCITRDYFLKGEKLEIRFYAYMNITGYADDMANYLHARFDWKLNKLYLKVT